MCVDYVCMYSRYVRSEDTYVRLMKWPHSKMGVARFFGCEEVPVQVTAWYMGICIYTAWPKKKLLQLVRSRHCKSAKFLNVLNDQVIPSIDFFSP